ncbi:MAG: GTPase HflX [Thermodesulfobacteriota bacterium]|nr:GTPase HflX [Thermodesulfobacteriota bacterium]
MKKLHGNTSGLKADQIRRITNLYRRKIPPRYLVTPDLARELFSLSTEISRQIGLLVNRQGKVDYVIVGDDKHIVIPDISHYRTAADRLKGLKCVHTHLDKEPLTRDDLTDLALLQLDFMAAIVKAEGAHEWQAHAGHIMPGDGSGVPYKVLDPLPPDGLENGCDQIIDAIEDELAQTGVLRKTDRGERAILVSVSTQPRTMALESLAELEALAGASNISVVDTVLQQRKKVDARFLMGRGKLGDLAILALQKGVNLLIFDQELNPSQIRSIADHVELKVIDRTQLILDIFARRARSREGKLQVEHAQLKYLLPRLATQNTAMSRLTGGIGGRGPGETKLEINRRRVRDRIARLEKSLAAVKKQRNQQKSRRGKKGLPVISIIGYTNAGKSTLLNTLTHSEVPARDHLFMTLDPTSRRMRFPRDEEVIITDTVGFIRDLPKELMVAFRATLEELESADLFVHVIDISNPRYEDHIKAVERILRDLKLDQTPMIYALNKQDRVAPETAANIGRSTGGIPVSANDAGTLMPLIEAMEENTAHVNGHM